MFFLFRKWEAALLPAIKLCPISPWRNKLVWLGRIYLARELCITVELEDILKSVYKKEIISTFLDRMIIDKFVDETRVPGLVGWAWVVVSLRIMGFK